VRALPNAMQCHARSADIQSNTPHINTIKHSNGDATNLKRERERERPNLNIVNILTIRIEEAKPLSYTNKSSHF